MSAYIVDDSVIFRVLGFLTSAETWFRSEFTKLPGFEDLKDRDQDPITLRALGQKIVALNYSAVNQRYSTRDRAHRLDTRAGIAPVSADSAFEALDQLIYQLSEGDVPTKPLYRALWDLRGRIACRLVREYLRIKHAA